MEIVTISPSQRSLIEQTIVFSKSLPKAEVKDYTIVSNQESIKKVTKDLLDDLAQPDPWQNYIKNISDDMVKTLVVFYYAGRNGYFEEVNVARDKLFDVSPCDVASCLEKGLKLWDKQQNNKF